VIFHLDRRLLKAWLVALFITFGLLMVKPHHAPQPAVPAMASPQSNPPGGQTVTAAGQRGQIIPPGSPGEPAGTGPGGLWGYILRVLGGPAGIDPRRLVDEVLPGTWYHDPDGEPAPGSWWQTLLGAAAGSRDLDPADMVAAALPVSARPAWEEAVASSSLVPTTSAGSGGTGLASAGADSASAGAGEAVPGGNGGGSQIVSATSVDNDEEPGAHDTTGPGPAASTAVVGKIKSYGTKPVVIIYHTHATESFLPTLQKVMASDARPHRPEQAFSSDSRYTVMRVGEELAKTLYGKHGISVVQSREFPDAGGRGASYSRSAPVVRGLLAKYPSARLVIDLHRDAAQRSATTITIKGRQVARIMFVVGSDHVFPHPRWRENYALAVKLNQIIEEKFPGLSRGVMIKDYQYNQQISPDMLLIEVGGVQNTLEEELATAGLLAEAIARLLRDEAAPGR